MTMKMKSPENEDVVDVRRMVTLAEAILTVWLGVLQSPSSHLQKLRLGSANTGLHGIVFAKSFDKGRCGAQNPKQFLRAELPILNYQAMRHLGLLS
jgi:hypothetical protein